MINWNSAFASLIHRFGARPAVSTPSGVHTYKEVIGRAVSVSGALTALGVQHGAPVATFLPNLAHAVWASIGVSLSGAAETPLNPALSTAELSYCLDLLDVRHVIADSRTEQTVRSARRDPLLIEDIGAGMLPLDQTFAVDGDAWGKILFTSGTTGRPKAILHSHKSRWLANLMLRASLPFPPTPQSRILLMTPYSHGASLLAAAFFDNGASIYLMDGVQTDRVRKLLASGEIDSMFAPPTVLAKLTANLEDFSCRSLRTVFCGTATLSPQLYKNVREMFGPVVRVTYGKTEIFNPITVLPAAECDAAYSSEDNTGGANLGWPVSGVEIEIRDESGVPCTAGTPGSIFLRAAHMMVGYIDGAGIHEVAPTDWHESGDVGMLTNRGELILIGRQNDVIKTGGYKVFAQEIELPLDNARLGSEIVAVGLPSQYWGQIIVVVAERPVHEWEAQAEHAASMLSRHKRRRAYITLPELPRNAQGKVQRSAVIEVLLREYRIEDGPHPKLKPL
jgi:acyl-coenzyme A synthetase/AMP-(fatty) acid ligase